MPALVLTKAKRNTLDTWHLILDTIFMSPDDLRQQIELKVVELIKEGLTKGTMTEAKSQEISRRTLEVLQPGMGFKELFKAISRLDDTMPELSKVVYPIVRQYEDMVKNSAIPRVREFMRVGAWDAAVKLAKDAANGEVELVWSGSAQSSSTT